MEQLQKKSASVQSLRDGLQRVLDTFNQTESGRTENLIPKHTAVQDGQDGNGSSVLGSTTGSATEEEQEELIQE